MKLTDSGAMILAGAICEKAVDDYKDSLGKLKREDPSYTMRRNLYGPAYDHLYGYNLGSSKTRSSITECENFFNGEWGEFLLMHVVDVPGIRVIEECQKAVLGGIYGTC